jgi:hypothetical protein
MDTWAKATPEDREALFNQTATAKGISAQIAKKGSLRFAPSSQIEEALRRDYEKMREMYFGQEPNFDEVMKDIRLLEKTFNERQ